MEKKFGIVDDKDINEFVEKLRGNSGTCLCSIDYDNPDMKCICKEFREGSNVGDVCRCGYVTRKE